MDRQYGSITRYDEEDFRILRTDDDGNLCVAPPSSGLPYQFFLTANGDGTGTVNLNGNYSGAVTDFWYEATTRYEIYSLLINISDNANFNQTDYGAILTGLTNGIKFYAGIPKGTLEIPLLTTATQPVKQNYHWLALTPETQLTSFAGLSQTLTVEINMIHQYGKPLTLDPGQSIIVKLNDNFTGLVNHTFGIRGIKY